MTAVKRPLWMDNVEGALPVRPQLVLAGAIRDLFLVPARDADGPPTFLGLLGALWQMLQPLGYEAIAVYDPVDGLNVVPSTPEATAAVEELLAVRLGSDGERAMSLPRLAEVMRRVDGPATRRRFALVIDYAGRLVSDPEQLTPEERAFFAAAEKLSHRANPTAVEGAAGGAALFNPVIWLVNEERELPSWLLAGNQGIRTIAVPGPDFSQRQAAAGQLVGSMGGADDTDGAAEAVTTFAIAAEGLGVKDMLEVTRLAAGAGLGTDDIDDAVRAYRVGILDNPWKQAYLRDRIREGEQAVSARVLGQDAAVRSTFDILKRSVTGLSGAQTAARSGRPRGVLFFAGPTGVGKTELAKQLCKVIFGTEDAYVRFDMSEFSAEHAEARLIGAPPGYVGYDAGGELTNAMRRQPFSLILFDEIEKAAPRILDKFLQILEDGRLTDGRGTTVYFSEAVIVFTSNLGIYVPDGAGGRSQNVTQEMDADEVEGRVRAAITDHFTLELNRPELLNRLGDNVVVFDFIRAEVAEAIFDVLVGNVAARVQAEQHLDLQLSTSARATLLQLCTADLSNGGRGIGTVIEAALVNPLARAIFDDGPRPDGKLVIDEIRHTPL
ncbi:MAG TPA: AAA family ATPase, partial [Euzebya sp.]|nr:AAA family ATPase [Euzebya sp.]